MVVVPTTTATMVVVVPTTTATMVMVPTTTATMVVACNLMVLMVVDSHRLMVVKTSLMVACNQMVVVDSHKTMVVMQDVASKLANLLGLATPAVVPTTVGVASRSVPEAGELVARSFVMAAENLDT